jgi:hypothetical protein
MEAVSGGEFCEVFYGLLGHESPERRLGGEIGDMEATSGTPRRDGSSS